MMLAAGHSYREVRQRLDCSDEYIREWKRRFQEERLAGLDSRYRGSQRRTRTAEGEARILEATRRPTPSERLVGAATRTNSGAALERITSAGTRIVVSRTEPPHASRGSEYASAPQDLLKAIERADESLP